MQIALCCELHNQVLPNLHLLIGCKFSKVRLMVLTELCHATVTGKLGIFQFYKIACKSVEYFHGVAVVELTWKRNKATLPSPFYWFNGGKKWLEYSSCPTLHLLLHPHLVCGWLNY